MNHTFRLTAIASVMAAALAPALAQQANDSAQTVTISASGRGQSRQVEAISAVELSQLVPGSSPLAAIARLPSVNFQSADAFGAYEWSTRITVRGFNQSQLGFTLDDVPLGDMSYGNHNGLHISRAIATENISRAVLSAGTGSLSTASSSNLGGTLQFYSIDPSDKSGADATGSLGSHNDRHLFARLETGNTGFGKAYLSLSDQSSEKWKGAGDQKQQQLNLKYVLALGDTKLSAFANLSRRKEIDYQDMSLQMISQLGYKFDNTYPDFGAALKTAQTQCGNGTSTYVAACDFAYYAGSGLRNDDLMGASVESRLSDVAHVKATAYHHKNKGDGLWFTPYTTSPDGTPIALRTTEYAINRSGLVTTADYVLGMNNFKASLWLEDNKFNQARRFYAVSPTAVPSPYDFPVNPFFTQWQYAFKTTTQQFSLEDTLQLSKSLALNFGFKSLDVKTNAKLEVGDPASKPQGDIRAKKNFLPQAGLTYALDAQNELFAGYAENMRAFQAAGTGASPFSTSTAGFNAIANTLKPETSTTLEGGWRLNTPTLDAVLAGYLINFKDRQLVITQGVGIAGNANVLANVGKASLTGLEASLSAKLAREWSWYNGLSLNKSQYDNDYVSNAVTGTTVATQGKTLIDTPKTLLKSVLSYDSGTLFANLGLDYQGERYYTYLNDGRVGGRTLINGALGYRLGNAAGLHGITLQLSGVNLGNRRYVSTIGSNGFVASDASGAEQTLLPGAPRAIYFSLSAKL